MIWVGKFSFKLNIFLKLRLEIDVSLDIELFTCWACLPISIFNIMIIRVRVLHVEEIQWQPKICRRSFKVWGPSLLCFIVQTSQNPKAAPLLGFMFLLLGRRAIRMSSSSLFSRVLQLQLFSLLSFYQSHKFWVLFVFLISAALKIAFQITMEAFWVIAAQY